MHVADTFLAPPPPPSAQAGLTQLPRLPGRLAEPAGGFSGALQKQLAPTSQSDLRKQAEEAATGLVSNALILPILKQIRRSPFAESPVFGSGIAEKTFGPEFDMQIADRIAKSPRLGIKNALVERILKKANPGKELDLHG